MPYDFRMTESGFWGTEAGSILDKQKRHFTATSSLATRTWLSPLVVADHRGSGENRTATEKLPARRGVKINGPNLAVLSLQGMLSFLQLGWPY